MITIAQCTVIRNGEEQEQIIMMAYIFPKLLPNVYLVVRS